MGKRTGKPRGRPPGSKSQHTREREAAVKQAAAKLESVLEGAFAGDAHAFLMAIYKDPQHDIALRIDAAKAAIRYEKPALAALDVKSENVHRVVSELTDAELVNIARRGLNGASEETGRQSKSGRVH